MAMQLYLCRLCMADKYLLDKRNDADFHDKVYECMSLTILSDNDYLPTTVCVMCTLKVNQLFDFRTKCIRVQSLLWAKVQEQVKSPVEYELSEEEDENAEEEGRLDPSEVYGTSTKDIPSETDQIEIINATELNSLDLRIDEDSYLEDEISNHELSAPTELADTSSSHSNKEKKTSKEIYRSLLKECSICGKMIERNRLTGHLNRHQGLQPYACSEEGCDAKFPCKIALRLHRNNLHSTQPQVCKLCSKIFKTMKSLNHHKSTYHSRSIFMCGLCSTNLKTNAQLTRHYKETHSDKQRHSCSVCSKRFGRKSNLVVHMRTHTKEKPYTCGICTKAFGYKRVLKEHMMRIHNKSWKPDLMRKMR